MVLRLGDTVLSTGDARRADGQPFGVGNVVLAEAPGAEVRAFVGADRVQGEHVRCDHGAASFRTWRVFASAGEAVAWMMAGHRAEAKEGALVYGGTTVFAKAVVTSKRLSQVGVTVITDYTVEG